MSLACVYVVINVSFQQKAWTFKTAAEHALNGDICYGTSARPVLVGTRDSVGQLGFLKMTNHYGRFLSSPPAFSPQALVALTETATKKLAERLKSMGRQISQRVVGREQDDLKHVREFIRRVELPLGSKIDATALPLHVGLSFEGAPLEAPKAQILPPRLVAPRRNPPLIQPCHRRTFFTRFWPSSNASSPEMARLFDVADQHPKDTRAQAAFYRAAFNVDPHLVIERFESGRFARDAECVSLYLAALQATKQADRAAKYFSRGASSKGDASAESSSHVAPSLEFGTKDRPLYVHTVNPKDRPWGRRISGVVNLCIIGGILYSIASMNEQRLGGISARAYKLFRKDAAGGKTNTFDDVQGCDEAKHELQEIVDFLKNPGKFNKLGAKMPKGILLVGPPGTGKTLLARAVAGEADVPFIYASGSGFDELFVGMGSMRIRQMFEEAKQQAPAIIFIDEIDAVGSKRSTRDPQHSRMSLNQLLIEMDGFAESHGIVVIAATNFPETLDKALLRPGRFDRHVHVPLPDVRGRKQIIDMYLNDVKLSPDTDTLVMARSTPGFSGADLFKVVNQAKILASLENMTFVTQRHLERSKDEMIMGVERKSAVIGDEERRLTAYHEGGHALVALHTAYANKIHKATIIPRGNALGMVAQIPEKDELSFSKLQLLARMDVAMGGRVAEELVFGPDHVTTGASSDFTAATQIARGMVTQYGMSSKLGVMAVSAEDWDMLSPEMRSQIDAEIQSLLEASRQRAAAILQRNRGELDRLAEALLEYETLNLDEIKSVLRGQRLAVPAF